MTRQEYLDYCKNKKSMRKNEQNVLPSVADPSMAQTGRDLVYNPKPIRYNRVTYSNGVPAAEVKAFDRMYADRLDVFQEAKQVSEDVKSKLSKIEKEANNEPPVQE